eukprot:6989782-Pyramimonas_sp.AAC.1
MPVGSGHGPHHNDDQIQRQVLASDAVPGEGGRGLQGRAGGEVYGGVSFHKGGRLSQATTRTPTATCGAQARPSNRSAVLLL